MTNARALNQCGWGAMGEERPTPPIPINSKSTERAHG
jgi:hypothetical protein